MDRFADTRHAIHNARSLLESEQGRAMCTELRQEPEYWLKVLDDVEAALANPDIKHQYSIIRTMDFKGGNALVDSELGGAILLVARQARIAGLPHFN